MFACTAAEHHGTEPRRISADEVRKHKSDSDCWVIIQGEVLSLPRSFLEDHPGGADVILALAGGDCTHEYSASGHSSSADAWTSSFVIGRLLDVDVGAGSPANLQVLSQEAAQDGARKFDLMITSAACKVLPGPTDDDGFEGPGQSVSLALAVVSVLSLYGMWRLWPTI